MSTPTPWIGWYTDPDAFTTGSEAIRRLITAQGVYEARTTPIGTFTVKRPDLTASAPPEGLTWSIPRLPLAILDTLLTQFRAALPYEHLANIYWEPQPGQFVVELPAQQADTTSVTTQETTDPYDPQRPRVLQVHSHGTLPAFFSSTDDADEQATGCYGVLGHLDTAHPTMAWRFACGGRYVPLSLTDLFIPERL